MFFKNIKIQHTAKDTAKVTAITSLKTRLKTAFKSSDKLAMRIAYSLGFVFLLNSCNLNIQEPAKTYLKISSKSDFCLDNFSVKMTKYFAAQISKKEFTQTWLCLASSIEVFASVIKTKRKHSFTVDEVFTYMSTLTKGQPVASAALKTETIAFKRWLVGGRESITKIELKKIATLLRNMLPSLLVLLDNMEFYNLLNEDSETKPDKAIEAILNKYSWKEIKQRLKKSKEALTLVFNNSKSFKPKTNYSIVRLKNFFLEIGFFLDNGKESKIAKFLKKEEKLFKAVQALLSPNSKTPGEEHSFSAFQWKSLLRFFSKSYPLFVQYRLSIQTNNLFKVERLDYFILWLKESLNLAKSILDHHDDKVITYDQLMPIFEVFYDKKLLSFKPTKKLLEIFIVKFFTPLDKRKNKKGLDKVSLKAMQQTIDRWARAQIILSGSVNAEVSIYLNKRKSSKDFEYFSQLVSIIQSSIYVFQKNKSASFYKNNRPEKMSPYNLLMYNNLLGLVEKTFYAYSSSYAKTVDNKQKGIFLENFSLKPSEIKKLTADTFQVAKTFGVKIPAKVSQISELIRVLAQFFSYSARGAVVESFKDTSCITCGDDENGDGNKGQKIFRKITSNSLSFIEIFEFFGIAYSALQKAQLQFDSLNKTCSSNCIFIFFEKLKKSTEFPILKNYFKTSSKESQKEFFGLLTDTIFEGKDTITQSKLFLSYSVFYFINSVMLRYDKDSSGVLDKKELKAAAKIFEGLVIQLLEARKSDTDRASIKQAFHFALTMPLDSTIWDKINFIISPPPLKADPLSLARILSAIISAK